MNLINAEIFAVIIMDETPKLGGMVLDITDSPNRWVQINIFADDQITSLCNFQVLRSETFEQHLLEEAWSVLCVNLTFLYRPNGIYSVKREQVYLTYGIDVVPSLVKHDLNNYLPGNYERYNQ